MTTVEERPEGAPPVGLGTLGQPDPEGSPGADTAPGRRHGARAPLLAGAAYLALAVLVWWNVWSSHPAGTTTCGCGDTSLMTWFLAWPAHAILHGLSPLYSTDLFHPGGVNLLANTAEVGLGVVLAPITWLSGPIASLNVALTLSPALSALAMFVLLRRWVSWWPAAFVGGLLYGFSPFVLTALTDGHLMLGFAAVPPLVVACLDELLIVQRRRPVPTGIALGVLLTVQFFVGTEMLAIVAVTGCVAAVFLAVGLAAGAFRHPDRLRARVRYGGIGLGAAAGSTALLLAYPVWFALAGPAHLSGGIWGPDSQISQFGTTLRQLAWPSPPPAQLLALAHRFGGYQAPTRSAVYLGIGLLAVLAVGTLVWHRDRRLWFWGAIEVFSAWLALGVQDGHWTPWRLFAGLPQLDNVIPSRFVLVTYFAAAVMLGIVVDHTHWAVERRVADRHHTDHQSDRGRAWAGGVAALVVAAIAVVPIGAYSGRGLPFTAEPVVVPAWFRTVAPDLAPGQVALVFPVPFAYYQSAMTWQATSGMSFAMVGGGGPGSLPSRAGAERTGQIAIGDLSVSEAPQTVAAAQITATRDALVGWGVTLVVLPDPGPLPAYERVHQVRDIVVLMTAATGRAPIRRAGAWVWSGAGRTHRAAIPSAAALAGCSAGPAAGSVPSIAAAAACVLAARPAPDGSA